MADRICAYIDGESHYIRSEVAWRKLHGAPACLERLRCVGDPDDRLVLVMPKAKVFWTRKMIPMAQRVIYFTSAVGDSSAVQDFNVSLRQFELEPFVIPELSQLAKQRQNVLNTESLIEKPKGVDIALAVRMLHDAYHDAFEACHLYTSDVDFLPVIKEVMSEGKQVFVHGYKNGLSSLSPMLHVPDQFNDLEEMLRNDCQLLPSA